MGLVMERGTSNNVGMIWNEVNNLFRLIYTTTSEYTQNTNVDIINNAPIMTGVQYISTGNFSMDGDARAGVYIQRSTTIGDTITRLYSGINEENLVITQNSVWSYEISLTAKRIDLFGDAASYKIVGAIARDDLLDTVYLVGTPSVTIIGYTDEAWNFTVEADTNTGALAIQVQGSAGKTVRWLAKINTLEVAFVQ
jgi:hypothetical protein